MKLVDSLRKLKNHEDIFEESVAPDLALIGEFLVF